MGNSLLFPVTEPTYRENDIPHLFWVPEFLARRQVRDLDELGQLCNAAAPMEPGGSSRGRGFSVENWIPCEIIRCRRHNQPRYAILYFHGNSCDMGDMKQELEQIARHSRQVVIHFEYPGYGLCAPLGTAAPDRIDTWGLAVARFLFLLGVKPNQLICMGRSIGTGAAVQLATSLVADPSVGTVGAVVLHSPYKSVRELTWDYAHIFSRLIFVRDIWNTENSLNQYLVWRNVALLIIHGQDDDIIPVRHGVELFNGYPILDDARKMAVFPPESQHNSYLVLEDVAEPLRKFTGRLATVDEVPPLVICEVPAWCRISRRLNPVRILPPPGACGCGCSGHGVTVDSAHVPAPITVPRHQSCATKAAVFDSHDIPSSSLERCARTVDRNNYKGRVIEEQLCPESQTGRRRPRCCGLRVGHSERNGSAAEVTDHLASDDITGDHFPEVKHAGDEGETMLVRRWTCTEADAKRAQHRQRKHRRLFGSQICSRRKIHHQQGMESYDELTGKVASDSWVVSPMSGTSSADSSARAKHLCGMSVHRSASFRQRHRRRRQYTLTRPADSTSSADSTLRRQGLSDAVHCGDEHRRGPSTLEQDRAPQEIKNCGHADI